MDQNKVATSETLSRPCCSQEGDTDDPSHVAPRPSSSSFVPLAATRHRRRESSRWSAAAGHPLRARGSPVEVTRRPGRRAADSGEESRGGGPGFFQRGRRSWWLRGQHLGWGLWRGGIHAGSFGGRAPEWRLREVGDVGLRGRVAAQLGRRWIRCLDRRIWRAVLQPWPPAARTRLAGDLRSWLAGGSFFGVDIYCFTTPWCGGVRLQFAGCSLVAMLVVRRVCTVVLPRPPCGWRRGCVLSFVAGRRQRRRQRLHGQSVFAAGVSSLSSRQQGSRGGGPG